MTWYWAVAAVLAVPAFWVAYAAIGDALDRAFQRRMDATLWDKPKAGK